MERKIAKSYFREDRLAPSVPAPPVGKTPRFNGDLGLKEEIDIKDWRLRISSEDASDERLFTMTELTLLPRIDTTTDFQCIEGWTDRFSYAGIKFSDFLQETGLGKQPDGTYYPYVGLETPDHGYYVSIDMPSMLHPKTLLAYEMNGKPLLGQDGAPLRLIIPVKYGIKSIKRIGWIRFARQRPPDYWAERGYDWYAGL